MDNEIITLQDRYGGDSCSKQPLTIVRGEGARLWDTDGRAYIDCVGGHGVANVGHANPTVVQAIEEQAQRLWVCPDGFGNDQRAQLLAELVRVAPQGMERVFLCNSGEEAVEAAIKFAQASTGRTKVVTAMREFYAQIVDEPLPFGFEFAPYNRLDQMEQMVDQETAAVVLEVVQGEGDVIPGNGEYLRGVQALCRERGALFIVNEVQTGFGRTGRMFASNHHDLQPDLMCVARGIASGFPMGAVLIGSRVGNLTVGSGGAILDANPMACAAALATINYIESEDLPQRAAELGAQLMDGLKAIPSPLVQEVRGMGLMVGVELKEESAPYLAALAERGVLALPAGATGMRFLPPLVISEQDVGTVVEQVAQVLQAS